MNAYKNTQNLQLRFVARASLFVMLVSLLITSQLFSVKAADLINRKIILGSSEPSLSTTHTFEFTNPTAGTLGSIRLEYCQNSPLFNVACTPPAGLNLTPSTLSSQSGNVGFTKSGLSTATTVILSRTPGGTLSTINRYVLSSVVNPSALDATTFVRVSLYATTNATGPDFDRGAIAFSTSGRISIGGYVPPFLIFCVGVTVAPNCSSTNGSLVDFGELSRNNTSTATTQFAAATNDGTGLQVFLNGQTMTSGNNIIPPLSSSSLSNSGTSQFGINLRSNSSPSVGANLSGVGSTIPSSEYGASNQFKFSDGDLIARSTTSTDFNRFTVSYIANVSDGQAPGIYATTLVYTALASF